MIFVTVYPITREGRSTLQPGDIFQVAEEEFMLWVTDLERSQARLCMDQEAAEALSASIVDGTFVLSPEVSQKRHSMQHGGIGTARKEIEGDEGLDQTDSGVAGLMKRIRRA